MIYSFIFGHNLTWCDDFPRTAQSTVCRKLYRVSLKAPIHQKVEDKRKKSRTPCIFSFDTYKCEVKNKYFFWNHQTRVSGVHFSAFQSEIYYSWFFFAFDANLSCVLVLYPKDESREINKKNTYMVLLYLMQICLV